MVVDIAPAWDDDSQQWKMSVKWLDQGFAETDVPEGEFVLVPAVTDARSVRSKRAAAPGPGRGKLA